MRGDYSVETVLTVDGEDIEIFVDYDAAPFIPARLYGPPGDCEPASGGQIDIVRVESADGPLTLTTAQTDTLRDWLYRHHAEQ